jgi:hypothetical protein
MTLTPAPLDRTGPTPTGQGSQPRSLPGGNVAFIEKGRASGIGTLIASTAMREVAARALQAANEVTTRRLLQRLGRLWGVPPVAGLTVVQNPRLHRTLGRLVGSPRRIELGPSA